MTNLRGFLVLLAELILPWCAHAAGPVPPCDGEQPVPGYSVVDGVPATAKWSLRDLQREHWQPPACLDWRGESRLVVALAARFKSPLTLNELAQRIVSVSKHNSIYYWAVTQQEWRPLVVEAWVTDGPKGEVRLPDPSSSALLRGRELYYAEQGGMVSRVVYRLRVLQRDGDRLILQTENVTPIKGLTTLFEPGGLRIASFLTRQGDVWNLYEIASAGPQASSLAAVSSSPYLNRLEAMRRYLAGIKTDQEPPLAPL